MNQPQHPGERATAGLPATLPRAETEAPATVLTSMPRAMPVAGRSALPLASAAAPSTLARASATAGKLVLQAQYQVARIGPAGQAGLAALTAAVAIAASVLIPGQHAIETLTTDLARTQLHGHAATPASSVAQFVSTLPTRAQMPVVLGQVFQQAKHAGVALDTGRYTYSPAKSGAIARYELQFPVKADYPNIRTFINGTLAAVPAAGLDKLHVERKSVGDTVVNADIRFVIFVRGE